MLVDGIPDNADYWESDSPEYHSAQRQILGIVPELAIQLDPALDEANQEATLFLLNNLEEAHVTFDVGVDGENTYIPTAMISGYVRQTRDGVAGLSKVYTVQFSVAEYFNALTNEEKEAVINAVCSRRKEMYRRDLALALRAGDTEKEAMIGMHIDHLETLYHQWMRAISPAEEGAEEYPFEDPTDGGGLMVMGSDAPDVDPTVEAAYWQDDDELQPLSEFDDPEYWRAHPDFVSARADIAALVPTRPLRVNADTDPETLRRYRLLLAQCKPEHVFFNLIQEKPAAIVAALQGYVRDAGPVDPFEGGRQFVIGAAKETILPLRGLYEGLSPAQRYAVVNEMYTTVQSLYRKEQSRLRQEGRFSDAQKVAMLISESEDERQQLLAAIPSDWGEAAH